MLGRKSYRASEGGEDFGTIAGPLETKTTEAEGQAVEEGESNAETWEWNL